MRKIVKKIGNSAGITFSKEDLQTYQLIVGDVLEMEIEKIKIEERQEGGTAE